MLTVELLSGLVGGVWRVGLKRCSVTFTLYTSQTQIIKTTMKVQAQKKGSIVEKDIGCMLFSQFIVCAFFGLLLLPPRHHDIIFSEAP